MTMELELDLGQEFTPNQTLKVSPRLVAANYILELSSQELQQQIATELNDNPALELVDVPTCRVCGTELQGSICPRCIQRQKGSTTPARTSLTARLRGRLATRAPARSDDEEFDPLTRVASEQTLSRKAADGHGRGAARRGHADRRVPDRQPGRKGLPGDQGRGRRVRADRRRGQGPRRAARAAGPGADRHRRAQPARVPAHPDRPPGGARPVAAPRAARSSASS